MSFYSDFAPYYEQVFPFKRETYSFLREHAGGSGGAVLDAGCGPGHYCGIFLHDGFQVTGIDLDQKMIEAASAAYPQALFRCIDIAEIDSLQSHFQFIYSIGNVLAHLPLPGIVAFLGDIHNALEVGGCWIFQVVNWDFLLTLKEYAFPVKTIADGSIAFHRRYSSISPEGVLFEVQLTAAEKIVFREHSKLYPLPSDLFLQLHQDAGFTMEGVYAGFDRSPFKKERNSGLVMVFTKR